MSFLSPVKLAAVSNVDAWRRASAPHGPRDFTSRLSAQRAGLRLTGPQRVGPCHACAFFDTTAEEYSVFLSFAQHCATCGERCVQYLHSEEMQERLHRLGQAGIQVGHGPAPGQMEVQTWDDAYLHDGGFAQDEMLALVEETMETGRSFGRTVLWGSMAWPLKHLPGTDDLVEYESRLNPLLEKHNDVVICAYEHGRYAASVVMDILRTHPMILVGTELKINPMYVPTARFLEDLRQRRAPRPGLRDDGDF